MIWHAGGVESYKKRYDELSNYFTEILIIVPEEWNEGGQIIESKTNEINSKCKIVAIKTFMNHHGATYFYQTIKLINSLNKFQPDIIHIHEEPWSISAFQTIILSKFFLRKNKPKIIIDSAAINTKKILGFKSLENYVSRNCDVIFARNAECEMVLRERGCKNPIYHLYNGVDEDLFFSLDNNNKIEQLKEKYSIPHEKKIIGFVGRMIHEKGIFDFLSAIKMLEKREYDDKHFIMVGNGPEKENVVKYIQENDLNNHITVLNKVPSLKMPEIMNIIDLLILPSYSTAQWKEQFGRVLIEAMSCGKAVIGSNSGGIPEVIGNKGYIFPEKNPEEIRSLICSITKEESLIEAKKFGKERVSSFFSWAAISKHYIRVLKSEKIIEGVSFE